MLRREVVRMGGSLFGLGAGTPSRFPYEDRPQPSPGIGPSQGQVVRARQVVVFGPGSRILVYSGNPAAGNLIASIAGQAGTDQFGNAYAQGVNSYGVAGAFAGLNGNNVQAGDGVATYDFVAQVSGGLHYATIGEVGGGGVLWIDHNGVIYAGNGVNGNAPETWHTLGALAAGSGYTVNNGRFRLDTDNFAVIDLNLTAGAATVAGNYAFANTLPLGYQPPFQSSYDIGWNGTTAAGVNTTTLRVSTGGAVTLQLPVLPNGTVLSATQRIPTS